VLRFPKSFIWGAATSAHQTEGANVGSDWWRLEHDPDMGMAEPSGDACDSYHRFGEDVAVLAGAGLGAYRFGVEWARIEPAPGEFSLAALQHYQRVIDACLARDVEPIITLHHFTNPAWTRLDGGWRHPGAVERYTRYVETVVNGLTGVRRWCTINEPNIIASYTGAVDTAALGANHDNAVTRTLLAAHQNAVQVVRAAGGRAGLTLAMCAYTTDGSAEAEQVLAEHRAADEDAFVLASRDADFLGVQVYTRRYVTASAGLLPHGHTFDGPNAEVTQMGWNYAPDALGDCLRRAAELAPGLPLLVTENGIATSDDEQRIAYTTDALAGVHATLADGIPVEGYLHWSLLDNFEWMHGYRPTFGLVAVDRESFERTAKPSLDWLGRVAKAGALAV
jgi:beta-glucosidase